ncbi:hypothetical protein COHA_004472 [Chlorella ohadii]|uniref:Uncharacterized protein n=1 Tax=Chlorella ohadii TaxID=2649997 RepID=A0AAD5DQ68_9CHLO|nr:hypothetical protein COHA_004472 [Chlorella ohadii]
MAALQLAPQASGLAPRPRIQLLPHATGRPLRQPRRWQPAKAAGEEAAGGAGGGRRRQQREKVAIVLPGFSAAQEFQHVDQRSLDRILTVCGALGFTAPGISISGKVEDLPEGGTVTVVTPGEPPLGTQVRNLQSACDNETRARELELAAFLRAFASTQHPGCAISMLLTKPYLDNVGQDYLQLDAGVRVSHELYVAEHKRVLSEPHLDELLTKLLKIRGALKRGSSPDLAAVLQGVTHVKLFLAGEAVREGLAVQELVDLAAAEGVSVVLPSGQGLGLAGAAAPALQL